MCLGKPVIYTAWDPNVPRLLNHLLPFHAAEGVQIVHTLEAFRVLLDAFCRREGSAFILTDQQKQARNEFVDRFLHQPDGKASRRCFHALKQIL